MSGKRFKYILVDVDTQNDFVDPKGVLYVQGAYKLVENFRRLIDWARRKNVPVLSSVDAHSENDPEFQQWPAHCVKGTWGQEKVPGTLLERYQVVPMGAPSLSVPQIFAARQQLVFEKPTLDVFDNPAAAALYEALNVDSFIVFGVATDYCVKMDLEGILRRGKSAQLVLDAIASIDQGEGEKLIENFRSRGVKMTTTAKVVRS